MVVSIRDSDKNAKGNEGTRQGIGKSNGYIEMELLADTVRCVGLLALDGLG